MSVNHDRDYLRREAYPLTWQMQTQSQKKAFEGIIRLLFNHMQRVDRTHATLRCEDMKTTPNWLASNRYSQIAFLGGGRGTGKSTLLSTLVKGTSDSQLTKELPQEFFHLQRQLAYLQSRLIWLEPIDMEPHPVDMNLIPSILIRIQHIAQEMLSNENHDVCNSDHEFDSERESPAIRKLKDLNHSLSQVWCGNLENRKSALTLDSYSSEIMSVERSRLELNQRLTKALNGLAETISKKRGLTETPIFILPLDDFDLNPTTCTKVLTTLRMISTPRLFTLVLGDLDVVDIVLNLQYSREFSRVNDNYFSSSSIRETKIAEVAGGLTAQAMRKMLPPSQRFILEPVWIYQGLNFRAGDHDFTLQEMIGRIPLNIFGHLPALDDDLHLELTATKPSEQSLLRYLLTTPLRVFGSKADLKLPSERSVNSFEDLDNNYVLYSGLMLFGGTLRQTFDLWLTIQRFLEDSAIPLSTERKKEIRYESESDPDRSVQDRMMRSRFLSELKQHVYDSLMEEPSFGNDERDFVRKSFLNQVMKAWSLSPYRLELSLRSPQESHIVLGSSSSIGYSKFLSSEIEEGSLTVLFPGKRSPAFKAELVSDKGERTALSERSFGGLSLLYDLTFYGPLDDPHRLEIQDWFRLTELQGEMGSTIWSLDDTRNYQFKWPLPPFRSFFQLDRFRHSWFAALKMLSAQSIDDGEKLSFADEIFAWISIGTATLINDSNNGVPNIKRRNWQDLFALLNAVLPTRYERRRRKVQIRRDTIDMERWASDLLIMFHPISGMNPESNPSFIYRDFERFPKDYPNLNYLWNRNRDRLTQRTASIYVDLLRSRMRHIATELRRFVPKTQLLENWGIYVSDDAIQREASRNRLDWKERASRRVQLSMEQEASSAVTDEQKESKFDQIASGTSPKKLAPKKAAAKKVFPGKRVAKTATLVKSTAKKAAK